LYDSPTRRVAYKHAIGTPDRRLRMLPARPRADHQPQLSAAARRRYDATQHREPFGRVEAVGRDAGDTTRPFHYDAGADQRTYRLLDLSGVISNTERDVIDWQIAARVPLEVHDQINGTLTIRVDGRQALD